MSQPYLSGMIRALILICALLAAPVARAWTFTPLPICTLANEAAVQVTVTYDGALYTIRITRPGGWPAAQIFSLRFAPNGPVISTTRHVIDGDSLSVTDRGFGNVLNGLQYNVTATALIGDIAQPIDLAGAAKPVEAFRACRPGPAV